MSDAPRANVGRLKRLVRWLITEPPEDALFGTNIRQVCRAFHLARGHRWTYERKYVRRCSECGEEEWMMVSRLTGERTWDKIPANTERLLPADRRRDAGKQDALVGPSESGE